VVVIEFVAYLVFTTQCTVVQRAVLQSHVICLSVCMLYTVKMSFHYFVIYLALFSLGVGQ